MTVSDQTLCVVYWGDSEAWQMETSAVATQLGCQFLALDSYHKFKPQRGIAYAVWVIDVGHRTVVENFVQAMHEFTLMRSQWPFAGWVILGEQASLRQVVATVNLFSRCRFVEKSAKINHEVIRSSLVDYQQALDLEDLKKEAKKLNEQLEEFTGGLERLVIERTHYNELQKTLIEKQQEELRRLVRFIKDLGASETFEDIIKYLRNELNGFRSLASPILAVAFGGNQVELVYFRSRMVTELFTDKIWPSVQGQQVASTDHQVYLANLLERPFGKTYVLPVINHVENGAHRSAVLFFEHDLSEQKIKELEEFFAQRLGPLKTAIDRLLLEAELRRAAFEWESIFNGAGEPIAIVNQDHQVIRFNKKFSQSKKGGACFALFAGAVEVCAGCPIATTTDVSSGHRQGIVHNKGLIYDVQAFPIDGSNESKKFVNLYKNITNSRELYLRAIQSEKMAALGQLAGNIAHELNNPLTGIRSLCQIWESLLPDESVAKSDLKEVEKAAKRSQEIIRNLLNYTQPDAYVLQDIAVNEIIKLTMPMLKTAIRFHNVNLDLSEVDLMVRVEVSLIQQVVFNLVSNGCQAMQENGTITITTGISEQDRDMVFIRISDTGPGIPENMQMQIFEPFFTTKKEGQGTGLGLSISRDIVKSLNGKLELKSEIGKGSSFTILLPLLRGKK